MSRKNPSNLTPEQLTTAGTPEPKKTRAKWQKSETVKGIEAQLKEARKLDRVLVPIPELSKWGCEQIMTAVQFRLDIVTPSDEL
jgi:hypothetical protein